MKIEAAARLLASFASTHSIQDVAKHVRSELKRMGIPVNIRTYPRTRDATANLVMFPKAASVKFSEDEQRKIRTLAKGLGLTKVGGIEIDIERMTDPQAIAFYLPA